MRFTTSQTSFKSGRLSQKLFNRIDSKQYRDGLSICEGFRVLPEGGAEKIKGRRWINNSLHNGSIGFEDSKSFSFQINGVTKVATITINTFNEVTLYVHTYPYAYGTEVSEILVSAGPSRFDPRGYSWTIENNQIILCHNTGKRAPVLVNFNDDGTYSGISFYSTSSVSLESGLPMGELRGDTLNIGNMNTTNRTIEITSADPSVVTDLQSARFLYLEGMCSDVNAGDGNTYRFIGSNYYKVLSTIGNGVVAAYKFSYESEDVLIDGGRTTVDVWSTNEWGPSDYPKHVTSHEGRVVFGGTPSRPLSLFGSKVGDPFFLNQRRIADSGSPYYPIGGSYSGSILPTDPYLFTISAEEDNEITNLAVTSDLFVGTDRREYIATGGDTIMSALSVQIKPYTAQGSYPTTRTVMEDSVVYIDSTRKKVYAFKYNEANGSFVSQELSILFSDLMEDDFVADLEWVPHVKALYIVTDKGILYAITIDTNLDTMAFYDTLERDVESLVYVAARNDDSTSTSIHRGDHVFTYKTTGVYALEQVFFEKGVSESYVKKGLSKENEYLYLEDVFDIVRLGASSYSINGQSYTTGSDLFPIPTNSPVFATPYRALNMDTGETVTVESMSPDGVNPWFLIDEEEINGASRIIVGNLPKVPKILATMPVEAGQQWGSAQMGIKNIDELGIRHYKSYSYDISSDGETWQEVRVADKSGNNTNGRENTRFSSDHKYDQIVFIRSVKPEPLVITGINMRGVSNDG